MITTRILSRMFFAFILLAATSSVDCFWGKRENPCLFEGVDREQPQKMCQIRDFLKKVNEVTVRPHIVVLNDTSEEEDETNDRVVHAIVHEANATLLHRSGSELLTTKFGESSERIRGLFDQAEKEQADTGRPVIIEIKWGSFLIGPSDYSGYLTKSRDGSHVHEAGEDLRRASVELLRQLTKHKDNRNIFVILRMLYAEDLDPEVKKYFEKL